MSPARLTYYETIEQSQADDATTLEGANKYTDDAIEAVDHDTSTFETIENSEAGDVTTLDSSKTYTDEQIVSNAPDLSSYETIEKSEADDATTLDSSKTYTDEQVSDLNVDQYQLLEEKGKADGYVPLSNVGKIPSEFLNIDGFEIIGTYGTEKALQDPTGLEVGAAFICDTDEYVDQYLVATSHSGDVALNIGESLYDLIPSTGMVSADQVLETDERKFVHPGDFSEYETIAKSEADDATTLVEANTYTDDQIVANAPDAPDLSSYETIAKSEEDDATTLEEANTYTDDQIVAYETIEQSQADDATTLEGANKYTDDAIEAVDLTTYETVEKSVADDATTLESANAYTDEKIIEGVPGLDDYETIVDSDEGDATTLASAKTYTDEAIGAVDLTTYETVEKSVADDATTLESANSYADSKFGDIVFPDLTGYETKEDSVEGDATTLESANAYTDEQIIESAPGLDDYETIAKSESDDAATLVTSKEYTDSKVSDLEVDQYQLLEEKGKADGYVPLNNLSKIPEKYINISGFEVIGVYGDGTPLPNPDGLRDGSVFICNTDGHEDQYLDNLVSHSGDLAVNVGSVYELIPSTGMVSADQVIETEDRVFVHPEHYDEINSEIDIIKETYLPLKGGTNHKMSGDIYMQQKRIKGIADVPDHVQDAVNQKYVDAAIASIPEVDTDDKVSKTGDTMTGQLNIQGANFHMKGNSGVTNLQLNANGDIDAKVITSTGQINSHGNIQMHGGVIHGLGDPTADKHAATKKYVDDNSGGDVSGKVDKAGDTMTGKLIFAGNQVLRGTDGIEMSDNIISGLGAPVNAKNATNKKYVDDADKDIKDNYLSRKGGTNYKMEGDIHLAQHYIKGLGDKYDSEQDAVNKKYVDAAVAAISGGSGDGSAFDGGTIHNTLTLDSTARDIDVTSGIAGTLRYNGADKFRWGSGLNFSEQTLQMQSHRITKLGDPNDDEDAVNLQTMNKAIAEIPGGGGGDGTWIGGTISLGLTLAPGNSSNRWIDVQSGGPGQLRYQGNPIIDWRNEVNIYKPLKMNDQHLSGLPYPVDDHDAATKQYVDSKNPDAGDGEFQGYLPLSGGKMYTGDPDAWGVDRFQAGMLTANVINLSSHPGYDTACINADVGTIGVILQGVAPTNENDSYDNNWYIKWGKPSQYMNPQIWIGAELNLEGHRISNGVYENCRIRGMEHPWGGEDRDATTIKWVRKEIADALSEHYIKYHN